MRTALALAVLCIASPVLAQAPAAANGPAQLRVTVLDQTSAGIPAAVVTVTVPGAAPVKVVADERGVATVAGLPAVSAQVHVEDRRIVGGQGRSGVGDRRLGSDGHRPRSVAEVRDWAAPPGLLPHSRLPRA